MSDSENYSGRENLEDMRDAINYNAFLKDLVQQHAENVSQVLDFGAGIGTYTDAIDAAPQNISCVEPDLRAQDKLKAAGYSVFSDLSDISDRKFSYVFSLNVLEHIENDSDTVRQLFEVIEPGGGLFVYVPAHNHIRTKMDDLVGHHRRYTRNQLIGLLENAGFEVVTASYTDVLGYFATWLVKILEGMKSILGQSVTGELNNSALILYDRVAFPLSRILSALTGLWFGKNVYIYARRPE